LKPLDLYAKIEPLIGFYDEYENLYSSYLHLLAPLHVKSVLDIGCGNGKFLKILDENDFHALGIDRSDVMVKRSVALGVDASTKELSSFSAASFDCAVAVADVLNYIKPEELEIFFEDVANVLKEDGYFLADVNTLAGFELADGVMVRDEVDKFLSVEAFFEKDLLTTNITFFEKENKNFKRSSGQVLQYYHPKKTFENLKSFKLVTSSPLSLFSDEEEKSLMLFQKIRT
jgi:predicted TPR repeat methyltransferase